MVCLTSNKIDTKLVSEALKALGKDNFALIIHGSSFPSKNGEDTGFGTFNSAAGRDVIDYAHGIFNALQLGPAGKTKSSDSSPYCGTIFSGNPLFIDLKQLTEKKWDNLTIRIYPGANAEFTLYEDEFDNYNYEKGAYSTITLKWNDQDRTLTIDDRKGSYKGMLKSRKFNLIVVEPGKGCGDGDSTTFDKSISYRGKKVIAKL